MAALFMDLLGKTVALSKGAHDMRDPEASAPQRALGAATATTSGLGIAGSLIAGSPAATGAAVAETVGGLVPGAGVGAFGTGLSALGSLGAAFGVGYGGGTMINEGIGALFGTRPSDALSDLMTPTVDEQIGSMGMFRVSKRGTAGIEEGNQLARAHALRSMQDAVSQQQRIAGDIRRSQGNGIDAQIARLRLRAALGNYED